MRERLIEGACFILCLCAYIPLIYLSNRSGLQPLEILPVSTVSCCITSLMVMAWLLITGKGKLFWADRAAMVAAWWAAPSTANIVLTSPATYALAADAYLAALTLNKLGSIAVALPAAIGGAIASGRIKLASFLCIAAIALATYGKSLWSVAHGGPWLGGVLAAAAMALTGWYVANYGWRIYKMRKFKKSMTFFLWEHLLAPQIALLILLGCWGASALLAATGHHNGWLDQIALGFTRWDRIDLWLLGVASQVVGLTGGWILVSQAVSAAGMLLYRCSALVAGVLLLLMQGHGLRPEHGAAAVVPIVLLLLRSEHKAEPPQAA